MGYLKQGDVNGNGKRSKKPKTPKTAQAQIETALSQPNGGCGYGEGVRESRCVAEAVDGLASIVSRFVAHARDGENGHSLYTDPNGYPVRVELESTAPVQVTLADNDTEDAMERFLSAFERIADSLARMAGLSRPRLEHWYEQDEYEPRYKSSACDGGKPGPAKVSDKPLTVS